MKLNKLRRRQGGVIDRRGQAPVGGGMAMPRGMGIPMPGGRGGIGIGTIILIVLLVFVVPRCLGSSSDGGLIPDPGAVNGFPDATVSGGSQVDPTDPTGAFVDAVGDDVQLTWEDVFKGANRQYRPTTIVLFQTSTRTGCGIGDARTGPFYCPADQRVYLDAGFFDELESRFHAAGDFAEAYVIAHEIGHHIQNLLGITGEVDQASQSDAGSANELSIRLELQADCLAGVWGHSANQRGVLEEGDLQEAITAAQAVGDDRIQESTTGRIDRESWTHGSADQRSRWLQRGFQAGNMQACDTFSVPFDQL
jgi:predicted metalloprotease